MSAEKLRSPRGLLLLGVSLGMAAVGCAAKGPSDGSTAVFRTPLEATVSWFSAINGKDGSATLAHFTSHGSGGRASWTGDPSGWPTFSHLRCRPLQATASTASVRCAFHESSAADAGQPDSFWDVDLVKGSRHEWLIDNYGQG